MITKAVISILVFFISCLPTNLLAQNSHRVSPKIDFVTGGTFRTTIMRVFSFQDYAPPTTWNEYYSERNIQGFAAHFGMELHIPHPEFILSYTPSIRRSLVYARFSAGWEDVKLWIVDHHLSILKETNEGKNRWGFGISVVNFNINYTDSQNMDKDIEFLTYNAQYQREIRRNLRGEFKVHYIPEGQYPTTTENDFLSYSIGLFYSFKSWSKKKHQILED